MSAEQADKLKDLASLRIDRSALQARPAGRPWLRWGVTVAILAGVAYAGLQAWKRFIEPLKRMEIETATATIQSPTQSAAVLTAAGYVVAQKQASVTSKVPGRLAELRVREGDRVRAGEILGRLENRDAVAALEEARRALDVARAAHAESLAREVEARREYERNARLLEEGVSSPADFDGAEARHKVALAQVDSSSASIPRAEASVTVAEVALQDTLIVSPFDGIITIKNAEVGEIVAPVSVGGPARGNIVIQIADMESLEAEVDVNETNIGRVQVGQPAEIILDAFPDRRYPGRLRQVVPTANRQKATIQAKVAFVEKGPEVLPEMSARVTFLEAASAAASSAPAKPRVFAPRSALVNRGGGQAVFVVREEKARLQLVTVGAEIEGRMEIVSGLSGGETLVINPPADLDDGEGVRPKKASS
jgi:RND family efflux transporter MFP subunit